MKREPRHLPLPPTDILTLLVSTAAVFFTLAFGGKLLEGYRLQRHNAMLRAGIGGERSSRSSFSNAWTMCRLLPMWKKSRVNSTSGSGQARISSSPFSSAVRL